MCNTPIGLIVIDSVAGISRHESDAVGRDANMRRLVLELQMLGDAHECAVVCVNQVRLTFFAILFRRFGYISDFFITPNPPLHT